MTQEQVKQLVDSLRHRPVATTAAQMREAADLIEELLYYKWRCEELLPLLEEARDALPAITVASMRLRGISPSLANRMDAVGMSGRERYDALVKS